MLKNKIQIQNKRQTDKKKNFNFFQFFFFQFSSFFSFFFFFSSVFVFRFVLNSFSKYTWYHEETKCAYCVKRMGTIQVGDHDDLNLPRRREGRSGDTHISRLVQSIGIRRI